ncbi:MAG: response regulator [Thermoanaerobaculum sp.]|nr:response regulator [Thermoanaerobaculum sp.]MDW7968647.1 response regulator [Thermoanaerobaculum sp.]
MGEGPKRIVVVDDSPTQCLAFKRFLEQRYPEKAVVETYTDPKAALLAVGPDVHLMLLDWEMPEMDGRVVLEEAVARGVHPKRIIVTSAHPADRLHEVFDATGCLCVIEKNEPEQQRAFLRILDSLMRR